jgi:hypothetical protein
MAQPIDSSEYHNTYKLLDFFRQEIDVRPSGVHVLISRGSSPRFAQQEPNKDVAAELGMTTAEADRTFLRAYDAGYIRADFGKAGPQAATAIAHVTYITTEGLGILERWKEPVQAYAPIFNIFGDNYSSIIGTQAHAQILQPTFTFGDLEQEIDRRGGEDAEALKEMIREIRATLEQQDSISRSWLLNWSEVLNQHAWITGPIAQLLLVYLVSGQIS